MVKIRAYTIYGTKCSDTLNSYYLISLCLLFYCIFNYILFFFWFFFSFYSIIIIVIIINNGKIRKYLTTLLTEVVCEAQSAAKV